ncbi:MAG: hypothetical protein M1608_10540 [Candidatus Omnitrophica bacterium]|nr:hypothetical protein [Candidatus Omnitrophota bacterium]
MPTNRIESFQNTLFHLIGNRAYLVCLNSSTPVTWSVTGRPSVQSDKWVPDAYNLRGFPIDPAAPPTFQAFFKPSPAHFNTSSNRLEKIYRLSATGKWGLVSPGDAMRSGEAYWVYTRGASDYAAPLELELEMGDGLDFGQTLESLKLVFANRLGQSSSVTVEDASPPAAQLLSIQRFSSSTGYTWEPLALPQTLNLAAYPSSALDNRVTWRLAIRRSDMGSTSYTALLGIRDGHGTRYLLPATAEKFVSSSSTSALEKAGADKGGGKISLQSIIGLHDIGQEEAKTHAGLWIGTATINSVSEVNSGVLVTNPVTQEVTRQEAGSAPTPTASEFNLRLIIHVDTNGQARLLKEVIQMWRNGTYTNDARGYNVVDKPGEYVLLTDESLVSQFEGASLRDGTPVGRRLSSVGYDFDGRQTNYIELTGSFAISNKLDGTLFIDSDLPTNPFKHKYHPDHDNLNVRFEPITDPARKEAYAVTRQITLEFGAQDPNGASSPDYGYAIMGGVYRETIVNLHKLPVYVQGYFRLSRAANIATLNPTPNP